MLPGRSAMIRVVKNCRSFALLGLALCACAPNRDSELGPPPTAPGQPGPGLQVAPQPGSIPTAQSTGSEQASSGNALATTDAWQATCAAVSTCGACLNRPPCNWCAGDARCVSPQAQCSSQRVDNSQACLSAPLLVARARHPKLSKRLARFEVVRETKSKPLGTFRQERFFINHGDCFAVLTEAAGAGSVARLGLHYAIQERGIPDPSRKQPRAEPATGAVSQRAQLSPEYCPFEPVYLVVTWLQPSPSAKGDVRLHLLRRTHPDPERLARLAPPPRRRGGSCSSMECGEDCRSELRACNLDCFRHGRREMGSDRMCKAGCKQALRSCERSCRIPCPR